MKTKWGKKIVNCSMMSTVAIFVLELFHRFFDSRLKRNIFDQYWNDKC